MSEAFDAIADRAVRWMEAWRDRDRAALEDILADDYSLVIASAPGKRFERAEWLELALGPYVCTRIAYREVQLRQVTDDLVAMSSILEADATMGGIDRSGEFFVADLWRRDAGAWKVCARFSSPLFDDAQSVSRMSAQQD